MITIWPYLRLSVGFQGHFEWTSEARDGCLHFSAILAAAQGSHLPIIQKSSHWKTPPTASHYFTISGLKTKASGGGAERSEPQREWRKREAAGVALSLSETASKIFLNIINKH